MFSTQNSQPAPTGTSVHRLEGKALEQWWQIPGLFARKRGSGGNQNLAISVLFLLLLQIPLFVLVKIASPGFTLSASQRVLFSFTGIGWISAFALFVSCVHRQLFHVLEVRASEEVLEFRSLFFKRQVRWLDMVDFFLTGNVDTGYAEYVLDCKNGEQFFLSKDLTESSKLFDLIARRAPSPTAFYELNYSLGDGALDMPIVAAFAVLFGLLSGFVNWMLNAVHPGIDQVVIHVIFPVLLSTLTLAFWWLHVSKVPQLMRAGRSALYIRTRSQGKVIRWDQITNITRIGWWLLVRSRVGWFVMVAPSKEPMIAKLLECKKNLPMLNRNSS